MLGLKFNKLTVVAKAHTAGHIYWTCVCECGGVTVVAGNKLRGGKTMSCGCARQKHGGSRVGRVDKLYKVWLSMRERCNNTKQKNYNNYGGRGITVCIEWGSYATFSADMGMRPVGHTLERIDNDKGYSKDNCRWATYQEQAENTRVVRMIEFNGVTKHLSGWARFYNIPTPTLHTWCKRLGEQAALTKAMSKYVYNQTKE